MKDMNNKVDANTKNISATNNKIQDIYSTLDTISRELATKIAHNISDDNPDPLELNLTYASMAAKPPIPGITKTKKAKNSSRTTKRQTQIHPAHSKEKSWLKTSNIRAHLSTHP